MEDTKEPKTRILVVMKDKSRCFVIDEGSDGKPLYRLPQVGELLQAILQSNDKQNVGEQLVLLITNEEISPWDLLDPFPPANYYDYGYMELVKTEDDPYWKDLKAEDKDLIEKGSIKHLLKPTS